MPALSTLALFCVACLALAATPGPDMLLIASRSVSQGRAAGFASLAGIQLGVYCHAMMVALGLSQLFLLVPTAYDIVRLAGAGYLLYLAWKTFRGKAAALAAVDGAPTYPPAQIFRQGLITNLLNPKMALFVLALFPQFVRPDAGSVVGQMLILATILNLIGLVVNGLVIMTAERLGTVFSRQGRFRRLPQYLLGTVFVGLAARLAFSARR
jgi:threonine/homoserine/homoserine lactone efflux protein